MGFKKRMETPVTTTISRHFNYSKGEATLTVTLQTKKNARDFLDILAKAREDITRWVEDPNEES